MHKSETDLGSSEQKGSRFTLGLRTAGLTRNHAKVLKKVGRISGP